jgi:hypothetical protein
MNDVKFTVYVNLEQSLSVYLVPNGEDVSNVENFYQMVKEIYHFKSVINLSEYVYLWLSVGLPPDRVEAIMNQIKMILKLCELLSVGS